MESLILCWLEYKMAQPLWKVRQFLMKLAVWQFLMKLNLPYDSVIVLLGIYPRKMKKIYVT